MVLVDIGGDSEVVRFLETSLGELAGRRNMFTTGKDTLARGLLGCLPAMLWVISQAYQCP